MFLAVVRRRDRHRRAPGGANVDGLQAVAPHPPGQVAHEGARRVANRGRAHRALQHGGEEGAEELVGDGPQLLFALLRFLCRPGRWSTRLKLQRPPEGSAQVDGNVAKIDLAARGVDGLVHFNAPSWAVRAVMSRTTLPVCPKTGSTSPSLTVHLCLHTALLREIGNAPRGNSICRPPISRTSCLRVRAASSSRPAVVLANSRCSVVTFRPAAMRAHAFTHREWTSSPAHRGYKTSMRHLLYREVLAWSPPVRNLEDALPGRSGVAIRGARGTPGQTTKRALGTIEKSTSGPASRSTQYTCFIDAWVRRRRVGNYEEEPHPASPGSRVIDASPARSGRSFCRMPTRGYLSWEQFEANQATLLESAGSVRADRRRSAPREGVALLQGIVVCGRCGNRMTVGYSVSGGHPTPRYVCQRRGIERAEPPCQWLPGAAIDHAVSRLVLDTVTPASIDVTVEVFDELRSRAAEIDRAKRAQIARLREDAELAQRQFLLVRPENRLVADNLERHWNQALQRLAEAEDAYARAGKAQAPAVTPEMKERVTTLVADLPRVWDDPRTPARDRKRMLRLLIEDVTLIRDDVIQISIRWRGGATRKVECPLPLTAPDLRRTPAALVEQVRVLATEQTDGQIAETLNGRWLRTGCGLPFTSTRVRTLRGSYDIDSYLQHLTTAGCLTVPQMAAQLDVHLSTAKRFAQEGVLRAVRADDKGTILFEPPAGPLPVAHPGKRFRDRRRYPKLASHVQEGA